MKMLFACVAFWVCAYAYNVHRPIPDPGPMVCGDRDPVDGSTTCASANTKMGALIQAKTGRYVHHAARQESVLAAERYFGW